MLIWSLNSPSVDDFYYLYNRNTESDLAVAFAVALRTNHPAAYEMIDSNLDSRLGNWMKTHNPQRCARKAHNVLSGSGSTRGLVVFFDCFSEDMKWYSLTIDDITIEDMKVIDWGEIKEENN